MIHIELNPARVERVIFAASSEMEDDFDHAVWLAIRPLVKQIDRRLRRIVKNLQRNGGARR